MKSPCILHSLAFMNYVLSITSIGYWVLRRTYRLIDSSFEYAQHMFWLNNKKKYFLYMQQTYVVGAKKNPH